jgi:hypothetical protein
MVNAIKDILFIIAGASQASTLFTSASSDFYLYDFDLDHHTDFAKPSDAKTFSAFQAWADQIFSSPKWSNGYLDLAEYDMTPRKMKEFNGAGPRVYPDTRYFAMSTWQTGACALNWNDQCSEIDINPIMSITANLMGDMDDFWGNNPLHDGHGNYFGGAWEQNDGLVSRISSRGPIYGVVDGSTAPEEHPTTWYGSEKYSKTDLKKGRWYYYDVERDHVQAIGMSAFWTPWFMYEHIRDTINAIKYDT